MVSENLLQPSKIWLLLTLCKFRWLQKTFHNHPMVTENLLQPLKYGNRCRNRNRIQAFVYTHGWYSTKLSSCYRLLTKLREGNVLLTFVSPRGGGVSQHALGAGGVYPSMHLGRGFVFQQALGKGCVSQHAFGQGVWTEGVCMDNGVCVGRVDRGSCVQPPAPTQPETATEAVHILLEYIFVSEGF